MDREVVEVLQDIANSIKILTAEVKELKEEVEKINEKSKYRWRKPTEEEKRILEEEFEKLKMK